MLIDLKLSVKTAEELKLNIRKFLELRKNSKNLHDRNSFKKLAVKNLASLRHRIPAKEYGNFERWVRQS